MDKKDIQKIEKIINQFFEKATFQIDCKVSGGADNSVILEMDSAEPQIYIGERGKTLSEMQKILAKIIRKQIGEEVYLKADINGYRANRERHLMEIARETADNVALTGAEKILFPMSSYERRVVHTVLADRDDIKTESVGEGEERRIVIRPS